MNSKKLPLLWIGLLGATFLNGCKIPAAGDEAQKSAAQGLGSVLTDDPARGPGCFNEKFNQSQSAIQALDILFIQDTSYTMDDDDNRWDVARDLKEFAESIPSGTDYRIGVMLAHGSTSLLSGKLYSAQSCGEKRGPVLDYTRMPSGEIAEQLRSDLLSGPFDDLADGGVEGVYSFNRGMNDDLWKASQEQGFFRPNAGLVIVFISSDADTCAIVPAGVHLIRDRNKGLARARDCGGITPDAVVSRLRALKGELPATFNAIVHSDRSQMRRWGDDRFGWGYLDLVERTGGLSIEIGYDHYGYFREWMRKVVDRASSQGALYSVFPLSSSGFDASSLQVVIDGKQVPFLFDASNNSVKLTGETGKAGSEIDISYCHAPVPAPSATPQPSPSPSPCLGFSCGGAPLGS